MWLIALYVPAFAGINKYWVPPLWYVTLCNSWASDIEKSKVFSRHHCDGGIGHFCPLLAGFEESEASKRDVGDTCRMGNQAQPQQLWSVSLS